MDENALNNRLSAIEEDVRALKKKLSITSQGTESDVKSRVKINWQKTDSGNAIQKGQTLLVQINEPVIDKNTLSGAILKNGNPVIIDDTRDGSKTGLEFPIVDKDRVKFEAGEYLLRVSWRENGRGEGFKDKFLVIE